MNAGMERFYWQTPKNSVSTIHWPQNSPPYVWNLIVDCSLQTASCSIKPAKAKALIISETVVDQPVARKVPDDCFKPFIFYQSVSMTDAAEDQDHVKVLRDMACCSSIILSGVLPLVATFICGTSTMVRGLKWVYIWCVPDYAHIHVKKICIKIFKHTHTHRKEILV